MACAYFVMYRGRPAEPAAFAAYYRDFHVPFVQRFPRIRSVEVHVAEEADAPFFLVARLGFDSREDLDAALRSPEREAARADMRRFPAFHGDVVRQIMSIEPIPAHTV